MMSGGRLTPQAFVARWRGREQNERQVAQQHFLDLCTLFDQPSPAAADPTGTWYTFEQGVAKTGGGQGFADVWRRGYFAWEYKGPKKDLNAAYGQLLLYREALENPPLLVVCDIERYEIHTNFTNTPAHVYRFTNEELTDVANQRILRALFEEPERLRPGATVQQVTEEAAARFGTLANGLRSRNVPPADAAHFLTQLLFCLFAEDVGLLPRGLFSDLIGRAVQHPASFIRNLTALFETMRDGGELSYKDIPYFNGGLFATIAPLNLTHAELLTLADASRLDWGSVDTAIIGTLFERSLDPDSRASLGAHYTGRADILRIVEPVVMAPLRREWDAVRAEVEPLRAAADEAAGRATTAGLTFRQQEAARNRRRAVQDQLAARLRGFKERLASVRILDPACGSGNFLTVALGALLDLEKEVVAYGAAAGLAGMLPEVSPRQLHGLEVNAYAHELAQVSVWIAYLQWMTANGFQPRRDPVLQPLDTIRLQDALLDLSDPTQPKEAGWPEAEFIIGNPPFLGGKRLRAELSDGYIAPLFRIYDGRVAREADLVCYFYERARAQVAAGHVGRVGLLATNSIRGGANRRVLERIKQSGDIFLAWSDEPWVLEGAAVRISLVGFDDGSELGRTLNGQPVATINPDLTATADLTVARRLPENANLGYMGDTMGGPFDVPRDVARRWLALPLNPNGRPNSDVVRPRINGKDVTGRPQDKWVVDFGYGMSLEEASFYEEPFEYVRATVKPKRDTNNRAVYRDRWWIHAEPRPAFRRALVGKTRYVVTTIHAKHRLFSWADAAVLPDHALIVFPRDDDYFFGVLHSRAHELWSLRLGTSLEDRPRYTPTTTFETFPFPWPPDQEPKGDPCVNAIASTAKRLVEWRDNWLNPAGASDAELRKRTLTNLYNQRPDWLANAHAALDRAVLDAYGWPHDLADDELLARLLALNLDRVSGAQAKL